MAIALTLITTVSGTVYLSNFNHKQKVESVKNEVETMLRQSQNYAKVRQPPVGYTDEVKYVRLQKMPSGKIQADVNGVGATYFSKEVDNSTTVEFNPQVLYFWGGSGQLSSDDQGTFFDPSIRAQVKIKSDEDLEETIDINYLGGVE